MDRASKSLLTQDIEWDVAEFSGDPGKLNRAMDYLLEEGTENPSLIFVNLENPAVSMSYRDPEDHVDREAAFERDIDVFRRNFNGSSIYLDPGDVHFIFSVPQNQSRGGIKDEIYDIIRNPLEVKGIETEVNQQDYSLRIDGRTISDMNYRETDNGVVGPGFVSAEPWDLELIDSLINLRGREEREFISEMPSLSDIDGISYEEYVGMIYDKLSADEPSLFEVPEGYVSTVEYPENRDDRVYAGWCPGALL